MWLLLHSSASRRIAMSYRASHPHINIPLYMAMYNTYYHRRLLRRHMMISMYGDINFYNLDFDPIVASGAPPRWRERSLPMFIDRHNYSFRKDREYHYYINRPPV